MFAEEMTPPWNKTTLRTVLLRYPVKVIFNTDKFDLLFQCLKDNILHLKGECRRKTQ